MRKVKLQESYVIDVYIINSSSNRRSNFDGSVLSYINETASNFIIVYRSQLDEICPLVHSKL